MAYTQSSRTSPLAAIEPDEDEAERNEDELTEGADEEDEIDEPLKRTGAEIKANLIEWIDNQNIARDLPRDKLDEIGNLVVTEFNIDDESRREWLDDANKALDFATQKAQPKQYPWPDSSNIIFPLITSAAQQFNARSYPAIIQNRNVVKGVIWGDDKGTAATKDGTEGGAPLLDAQGQVVWKIPPGDKKARAQKIGEHMSWQLIDQMTEWEPQTDDLLMQLPIVGGVVRKTYRDVREDKSCSVKVEIKNLAWNFHAPSFEKAPRHTEIQEFYPHEIEEFERDDETFLPIMYGPGDASGDGEQPTGDAGDSSAAHEFLEQHRRYDLDNDGYPEPLIITVHRRSARVVRIVARYEEEGIETKNDGEIKRIKPIDSYTLYRFLPNPKGGSYPVGFGHLLKPLNEAVNTTINQMFDAGHLQIAGGGFIGTGLSIPSGPSNFAIGEYKPVQNKGMSIRDSVFPIPWPGPSAALFQLLGFLVSSAKEIAAIQDILTGDAALANTPPTTMLALVEQGMKVYTAIHKRVFRALKSELDKLYRLNRIYLQEDERYRVGDTWLTVTPEDYRLGGGVEPIADPTMITDMQRLGRANVIYETGKSNPLVNPLESTRRLFEAANIDRINDLLPDKMPPPKPTLDDAKIQQITANAQAAGAKQALDQAALQSKIGLERSQALQAYTQAELNFQKSRSTMSEAQTAWMDNQLAVMRLHIEAMNTAVKAATVDASIHGHDVARHGHELAHAGRMADIRARASEAANEQPDAGSADAGGGAGNAPAIPQPQPAPDVGGGISGVAPQPGDTGLPPVPGA